MRKLLAALLAILLFISGPALFADVSANAAQPEISSREELVSYLTGCAASHPGEIQFEFSNTLISSMQDSDWMADVIHDSGIATASWSYSTDPDSGTCTLYDIEYLPEYVACYSEEDVVRTLSNLASNEITIRLEPSLFEYLMSDNGAALLRLEGEAGIYSRNLQYNSSVRLLWYSEIEYVPSMYKAENLEQLKQHMVNCTNILSAGFTIHCSGALYSYIQRDGFSIINEIEANCGILSRDMYYNDSKKLITFSDITYYPGMRIIKAIENNCTYMLTQEEIALYETAVEILQDINARSLDFLQFEYAIHDAIIDRSVYELDIGGDRYSTADTAFGALMYGTADCDGYADAFFLLGNLVGFNVGYQVGYDPNDAIGHMWNTIEINGEWYFVDVTFDASNFGPHHIHINFGRDWAQTKHIWNEEAAIVPLAEYTNSNYRYHVRNDSSFTSIQAAQDYINHALACGQKTVAIEIYNTTSMDNNYFLGELSDGILTSHKSYTKYMGNIISHIVCPIDNP